MVNNFIWADGKYTYPHITFNKAVDRNERTIIDIDCHHCGGYGSYAGIDILASIFVNNFGNNHKYCLPKNELKYQIIPFIMESDRMYCSVCNAPVQYTNQISFDVIKERNGPVLAICDSCIKTMNYQSAEKAIEWTGDRKTDAIFCPSFIITTNKILSCLKVYKNFKSYKTKILQPNKPNVLKDFNNVFVICLR